MRPPSKGWYTHDEQIRAELDNLRKELIIMTKLMRTLLIIGMALY